MSDDLVSRLREPLSQLPGDDDALMERVVSDRDEAATALEEARAEIERLNKRLDLLAAGFGVPDGGRYIADWQTRIKKYQDQAAEIEGLQAENRRNAEGFAFHAARAENEREGRLKAESELSTLRDMLVLCGELGGMGKDETPAAYLRRLIDEVANVESLRARVREVVGPFAAEADGTRLCGAEFGDDWKPFLHRSYTEVDITNGHLRAARQLMEEVK